MAWIILLASAVCEAVWATALGLSDGLRSPLPTIVFVAGLLVSMLGLGRAMKQIPIGTAYAVWVGVGAALTVTWAMATGAEPFSVGKGVFIAGIIVAVVGLKLVPAARRAPGGASQPREERGREGEEGGDRYDEGGDGDDTQDDDVAEDRPENGPGTIGGETDAVRRG
ncbi:multidrug efflux SMR transporter [Microbacterium sp. cf332]|uniref:DMT family transporter n=1 Tax=Microbacterium sp. cf332 TaxID=1761804 RepID=UPI00089257DD|nr:quaternary ammonium compound-resistance protein SugE [Microbacterium sp. cf332]